MFLLRKSHLDDGLYVMGATDTPSVGSTQDLYTNVYESANILDPFDTVFHKTSIKLGTLGYEFDEKQASELLTTFYNDIRNGLSFDWVMNYVIGLILKVYPFSYHFEFKGTQPFIDKFMGDPVFVTELSRIRNDLDEIIDWVFNGTDRNMFVDMVTKSGTTNLEAAIQYLRDNDSATLLALDLSVCERTNYLVLLMEMLQESIGFTKRSYWTDRMNSMIDGFQDHGTDVIVCGAQERAFAFGDIDGKGIKWNLLTGGIKMNGSYRTQRKEYIRAFPDQMTFFKFVDNTLYVDETYFPTISIGGGDWMDAVTFQNSVHTYDLDKPLTLKLKYKFNQNPNNPKTIKLRAGANCVVKDQTVVLDEDGVGTTQIVFRSNTVSFKVSDPDKMYPFAFFSTKDLNSSNGSFAWL